MARGFSRIVLVGNLGADPELRYAPSGNAFVRFNIAVGRRSRDASGNWGDATDWYRITLFGNNAEVADRYLKKGHRVLIDGRLELNLFTGRDGNERMSAEVIGDNFTMLSTPEGGREFDSQSSDRLSGTGESLQQDQQRQSGKDKDFDDFDDVPF